MRRLQGVKRVLIVATASLKAEWQEQINTFCHLPITIIQGSRAERLRQYQQDSFFYISNYEQIMRDHAAINERLAPNIVVLDEAQRIKNWRTKNRRCCQTITEPLCLCVNWHAARKSY